MTDVPESPTRSRVKRWRRRALELGLVLVGVAGVSVWQTRSLLGDGTPAPDVSLIDLSGRPHRLAEFRGQPVALTFWAPWCEYCKAEVPNLSRLSHAKDAKVVSVALDFRSLAQVRAFVAKNGVDYPVLLGDSEVARRFGLTAFPTTYFLDPQGRVRHESVG